MTKTQSSIPSFQQYQHNESPTSPFGFWTFELGHSLEIGT